MECVDWPKEDVVTLIKRMQQVLPAKDNLCFKTRAKRISWRAIAFGDYSGEDCRRTWGVIQKRLRRFRVLNELLGDALDWVSRPWTDFYQRQNTKRHPDKPRFPLSAYVLYGMRVQKKLKKKGKINTREIYRMLPAMWRRLSPSKREIYNRLALEEKNTYRSKLKEFYKLHPELKPQRLIKREESSIPGIVRCSLAFELFFKNESDKLGRNCDLGDFAFRHEVRNLWNGLENKQKLVWIERAVQHAEENQITDATRHGPILTKRERTLREKSSKKPRKPPGSGYGLFTTTMLRSKEVNPGLGSDRMKIISDLWRRSSNEEKEEYSARAKEMGEQYRKDYADYLESLTVEGSKSELNEREKQASALPLIELSVNVQRVEVSAENEKREPIKPPLSAAELFAQIYTDKENADKAWGKLSVEERKFYERELRKLKKRYLSEYEVFLKNLDTEELAAYMQSKTI